MWLRRCAWYQRQPNVNYDRMQRAAARQQLRLLGGVIGVVTKSESLIENVLILVQKNIELTTEGGLRTDRRNIASLLVEEVGKLARGDVITVSGEALEVSDLLDDDTYVVRVLLRG